MMNNKTDSYLIYKIGNETFATNVASIVKILEITDITKIPGTANYIKGIINLRGSVLPVVDSRIKLGFERAEFTKNTCIVVFELEIDNQDALIGAIVDSVIKVTQFNEEKIIPPPSVGLKFATNYLLGVYNIKSEFILIIDINKVFSSEDLIELSKYDNENKNLNNQ